MFLNQHKKVSLKIGRLAGYYINKGNKMLLMGHKQEKLEAVEVEDNPILYEGNQIEGIIDMYPVTRQKNIMMNITNMKVFV